MTIEIQIKESEDYTCLDLTATFFGHSVILESTTHSFRDELEKSKKAFLEAAKNVSIKEIKGSTPYFDITKQYECKRRTFTIRGQNMNLVGAEVKKALLEFLPKPKNA